MLGETPPPYFESAHHPAKIDPRFPLLTRTIKGELSLSLSGARAARGGVANPKSAWILDFALAPDLFSRLPSSRSVFDICLIFFLTHPSRYSYDGRVPYRTSMVSSEHINAI